MKQVIKKAALAAAIVSAPLAASASNLYGGGATLPTPAYVGDDFVGEGFGGEDARLSTNAGNEAVDGMPGGEASLTSGSIFQLYSANSGNNASYCQTGSGTGKNVLLGGSGGIPASGDCNDYSTNPEGFSVNNLANGDNRNTNIPDFSGSDAPLTLDDFNTFTDVGGREGDRGNLVQVPALGAFLALPINTDGSLTFLNLSTSQVCDIFRGQVQDWNDLDSSIPNNTPIHVVFRSDDSGTVFAFSQFLASSCNPSIPQGMGMFTTREQFAQPDGVPQNVPDAIEGIVPPGGTTNDLPSTPADLYASYTAASGNTGVVNAVLSTPYSIGFANYANVDAQNADYAWVNFQDPANETEVNLPSGSILTDKVLGNPNSSTGLPTISNVPTSYADGCVKVVDPAVQLTQSYPIVAFTNLLGYTDNNNDVAALRRLFKAPLDITDTDRPATPPVGYAYLDDSNATALQSTVDSCIN